MSSSSLDPEKIWKTFNLIEKSLGHMNKAVVPMVSRLERASTKIVAAHSKTKGIMLGVVADLDLMTGAFGKIKVALANLLLPVDKNASKLTKLWSSLTSVEGAWTHVLKPMWAGIKAKREESKVVKEIPTMDKPLTELLEIGNILPQFETITGAVKDFGDVWGEIFTHPKFEKMLEQMPSGEYEEVSKFMGMEHVTKVPRSQIFRAIPPELTDLKPYKKPPEMSAFEKMWDKLKKPVKSFHKNVALPLRQIASGGLGLGFQATVIMGLMQAFSSLFQIFQPVIDIVGILMERLSVGFMPLIEIFMEILTSPPVLAMIDMLSTALAQVFEMFKPLIPIIIKIIQAALQPLMSIFTSLMPTIQVIADLFVSLLVAFLPLIELLFNELEPIITTLLKVFLLLVVLGLYPLMYAIYGIGLVVAGFLDLISDWSGGNVKAWKKLMKPILAVLDVAAADVLGTFQHGTDYVPQTGLYHLTRGEGVRTVEENRGGRSDQNIVINIDGGIWVQDVDEFVSMVGRKLSLIRG